MKTIKMLTFATLAAVAATLLFQTSITCADDRGKRDHHGQQAWNIFTKRVTTLVNQPGLVATMAGADEGDAGVVIFTGDVLKQSALPPTGVVAVCYFTGTKHSFSTLIHGFQSGSGVGATGVTTGVVISGRLKATLCKGNGR